MLKLENGGKRLFYDFIFLICGHLDQNEYYETTSHVFYLGGHFRPISYKVLFTYHKGENVHNKKTVNYFNSLYRLKGRR